MASRRKIPTKTELLQLQKLYKTDEKIGERLGGVPAYLVAYWRRKKNVPKHSQPKFSEKEVRTLWERFGDDDRCGLELGISKAAFYNWRRRYNIREKPAFLKLEQLEFDFPGARQKTHANHLYGKRSVAQKILARAADEERVDVGQELKVEPDVLVVHGSISRVVELFQEQKTEFVWNSSKMVVTLDGGDTDGTSPVGADHRAVAEFIKRQNIKNYFDMRAGLGRQVAVETGQILPGSLTIGTDAYAPSFGCLSSIACTMSVETIAELCVVGKAEVKVPESARLDLTGRRNRGVFAKDVALSIIQRFHGEGLRPEAIEFYGPAISQLSVSERFTLCDVTVDLGSRFVYCGFDSTTRRYLNAHSTTAYQPVMADKDAIYTNAYQISVEHLEPQIAGPDSIAKVRPVAELEGVPVHQFVLGTCTNGRFDDLRVGAEILKGKKVHRDCTLVVVPGSRSVYLEALKKGLIRLFIEAGAIVAYPGYGPANGSHVLLSGERCLTTGNGSAFARLGTNDTSVPRDVYVCSPATVAASALNAQITDPSRYVR